MIRMQEGCEASSRADHDLPKTWRVLVLPAIAASIAAAGDGLPVDDARNGSRAATRVKEPIVTHSRPD